MPRQPRISIPGIPMHITHRGHNRQPTFLDATDFATYRALLLHERCATHCDIHAYALMTNHVHLLVRPQREHGASELMQRVASQYVRYFNKRHGRSGTAWEGRFKSALVDSSTYLLACLRYIDLNPVRAGLVASADAYEWSSYRRLGCGENDALITPHEEYFALDRTPSGIAGAYRAFCASARAAWTVDEIRHATDRGIVFGGPTFRLALEQRLHRTFGTKKPGAGRRHQRERAA